MDKPFIVYGAKGSGSVPIEATLRLLGLSYEVVEAPAWEGGAARERAGMVNPLAQVPTLVLPSGEVMTESAAILMWLAEQHPGAHLAPPPGDPARAAYLRWMVYVPAAIYPMFWIRDEPSRLAADAAAEQVILQRTSARLEECWAKMDAQVDPGRYLLGDELSVLDLYVAVVSRWSPRRARFYQVAPKMAQVVRRVDEEPRLKAFWDERIPPRE